MLYEIKLEDDDELSVGKDSEGGSDCLYEDVTPTAFQGQ
jgi:hypothetical protein